MQFHYNVILFDFKFYSHTFLNDFSVSFYIYLDFVKETLHLDNYNIPRYKYGGWLPDMTFIEDEIGVNISLCCRNDSEAKMSFPEVTSKATPFIFIKVCSRSRLHKRKACCFHLTTKLIL